MNKEKIKQVFAVHPTVNKVFIDGRGKIWLNEETAKKQPNSDKMQVVKRTDFEKKIETKGNVSLANTNPKNKLHIKGKVKETPIKSEKAKKETK